MDTKETEKVMIQALRQEAEKKYRRKMRVLADRLGWDKAKLSRILSGEQGAKLEEVLTLCAVLSVSLPHLLRAMA